MRKILIVFGSVVLLAAAFLAGCYFTPRISVRVSRPVDANAESYVCRPMLVLSEKLGLPLPPHKRARVMEFSEGVDAVDRDIYENYTKPMQIDVSVAVENGRTVVTYAGTATNKNGTAVPYEKKLVFDFVLTRDVG